MAKVLVLRTCNPDMTAFNGFKWKKRGKVLCEDWKPTPKCGNGFHGLLWGEGRGTLLNWNSNAKWLVVSVDENNIINLKDKVKFSEGIVVHCGNRESAVKYLLSHGAAGKAIVGATIITDGKAAVVGDFGIAKVGDGGTAMAGERGSALAGNRGIAVVGEGGTASSGEYGKSIAGSFGTAIVGDFGVATVGAYGTVMAGKDGEIRVQWWKGNQRRTIVEYVGRNYIEPNVKYKEINGIFVKTE